MSRKTVLVLGGGPDAEREVSLVSSKFVAEALQRGGEFDVNYQIIDRANLQQLRALAGDVVFPVLHGGWGEGGPLQDLLDQDRRPYVGCRGQAARVAMDKMATKLVAASLGIPTKRACVINGRDHGCPIELPVVVKPVHEGSSVGVHICRTSPEWLTAIAAALRDMQEHPRRVYMVEQGVLGGSELTVGVFDGKALLPIQIKPAVEFYDYEAKYQRNDTQYLVDPLLPAGVKATIQRHAEDLFRAMGCRHLSRIDFLLDREGMPWLLEVNTLPGFTDHSLFPMAAKQAGMPMEKLCSQLVHLAIRDGAYRDGKK